MTPHPPERAVGKNKLREPHPISGQSGWNTCTNRITQAAALSQSQKADQRPKSRRGPPPPHGGALHRGCRVRGWAVSARRPGRVRSVRCWSRGVAAGREGLSVTSPGMGAPRVRSRGGPRERGRAGPGRGSTERLGVTGRSHGRAGRGAGRAAVQWPPAAPSRQRCPVPLSPAAVGRPPDTRCVAVSARPVVGVGTGCGGCGLRCDADGPFEVRGVMKRSAKSRRCRTAPFEGEERPSAGRRI